MTADMLLDELKRAEGELKRAANGLHAMRQRYDETGPQVVLDAIEGAASVVDLSARRVQAAIVYLTASAGRLAGADVAGRRCEPDEHRLLPAARGRAAQQRS